ncbi:MAG: hypothetical protein FWB72_00010 [Firmicutes bacterium]|nr:hypothetical protein [Bacillota bacterium]
MPIFNRKKKLEREAKAREAAALEKERKALEQRMLVKRTLSNMNKFVLSLEPKKTEFIEKARVAQLRSSTAEFNLAKLGLKAVVSQQRRAEAMILNFQITSQLKDLTKMTGEFLAGLSILSNEMAQIADNSDFAKTAKEFNEAMLKVEGHSEKMESFLEHTMGAFEGIADMGSDITDAEIDKILGAHSVDAQKSADVEIDLKLKDLERRLKE